MTRTVSNGLWFASLTLVTALNVACWPDLISIAVSLMCGASALVALNDLIRDIRRSRP